MIVIVAESAYDIGRLLRDTGSTIIFLEFMPYSLMLLDGMTTISPEAVIRHSLGFFYIHRDLRCRSPPDQSDYETTKRLIQEEQKCLKIKNAIYT